jgi:hypothetical protein
MFRISICFLVILGLALQNGQAYSVSFGSDSERPIPEFSREENRITARLIPRGKSSPVQIHFASTVGRLDQVNGLAFKDYDRPEVDWKNFKSDLFEIKASGIPQGGKTELVIYSDFFSSSTQFFIFNSFAKPNWIKPQSTASQKENRIFEIRLEIQDGGLLDSDGKSDGTIIAIGGPRDSFWGYAIGTLFIRFFGIFIVLGVLMAGMMISGLIFQRIQQSHSKKDTVKTAPPHPEIPSPVSPEIAAVAALALYLETAGKHPTAMLDVDSVTFNSWSRSGRLRIMNDRISIFRLNKK